MNGPLEIGSRVLRYRWEAFPDWQHLARRGRITHIAGPNLVEVIWDAGEFGAPAKTSLERIDDLTHLWWRST